MTHTLHREGTKESLQDDFVLLIAAASGFNREGCAPRIREMLRVISSFNPINMGGKVIGTLGRGMPIREIIENVTDGGTVQAVFDEKEIVIEALKALREADLGISVTIAGVTDDVKDIVRKAGVGEGPHTSNLRLGFIGKREKVATDDVRLITTMCGHHMISSGIVVHLLEMIKDGRITPMEAAIRLSRQCTCGAFNPVRAARIMEQASGDFLL